MFPARYFVIFTLMISYGAGMIIINMNQIDVTFKHDYKSINFVSDKPEENPKFEYNDRNYTRCFTLDEICITITTLSKEHGIRLIITVDNYVIVNDEISVENPPDICFLRVKFVRICLSLYNLHIEEEHFKGCVKINLKYFVMKYIIHLGCFNLPYKNYLSEHYIGNSKILLE